MVRTKKTCKYCGNEIPHEKRRNDFCNHTCSASFNNIGVRRYGKRPNNCLICGALLKYSQGKFCSRKCYSIFKWETYKEKVEKDQRFPTKKAGSGTAYKNAKKFLIEKFGHECSICKIKKWRGQNVPLVFDHINGNAEDWTLSNCRVVCRNCDGQLSTFAGRNKGKGSKYRYSWRNLSRSRRNGRVIIPSR